MLYCTVCDNNNGNCTVHNTTKLLAVEHQEIPFKPKPYEVDKTNPFYRYDPDQCILCGRCVEACQNVQVNETLSINWEDPHPRVLWDGGATIGESSCVSCGHCVTVCPCNALMEKSMLGQAGYFTRSAQARARGHDRHREGHRAGDGLWRDPASSPRPKRPCANRASKRTKTVCTYCGVGCSFDIWTKGPPHPESRAGRGRGQRNLHLHQRQVRLGFCQQPRPPDHAADSRRGRFSRGDLGRGSGSGRAAVHRNQGSVPARTRWLSSPLRNAPTRKAT